MYEYRPHVYVGDHTVLTNLNAGPAMYLDLRDPVCMSLYLYGEWEPWITGIFLSLVKPGMVVLDIGSHSGYFSLLAAMQVGPTGAVHSFEPNPFHHRNSLKSAIINGYQHVQLHRVMLSDQAGDETIETWGEGGTSIFYPNMAEFNGVTKTKVKRAILTDLLGPTLKADIIKIDIDGGEPYIMDSLFKVIEANGKLAIFMEYLPQLWEGQDPGPIMQRFIDHNFQIYKLPRVGDLTPVTLEELLSFNEAVYWDLLLLRG